MLPLRGGNWVLSPQASCRELHRLQDVLVARTAADVAAKPILDLVDAWIWNRLQQLDRRHEKTWRAESALQAVLVAERFLNHVQLAVRAREPLDGHQFG